MITKYYGRFHGPSGQGRILAEVYKSTDDEGLVMDHIVESHRCFTQYGAKKWIEKTIIKLSCDSPAWFYVVPNLTKGTNRGIIEA